MRLRAFDGRLFAMYMEHLPRSLARGVRSPFTPSDASTIHRDISSTLSYLVTQKVIHNDIKPGNIAYSPEGRRSPRLRCGYDRLGDRDD